MAQSFQLCFLQHIFLLALGDFSLEWTTNRRSQIVVGEWWQSLVKYFSVFFKFLSDKGRKSKIVGEVVRSLRKKWRSWNLDGEQWGYLIHDQIHYVGNLNECSQECYSCGDMNSMRENWNQLFKYYKRCGHTQGHQPCSGNPGHWR